MYQVLYRKYRPRVFADVYGQDHITTTLKNEIKENRIAHAYLFTGSRGTGKTSCAKIFAKAVNCENSVNGEPCNECEVCKGLDDGAIYDVVEIDAASNNGVDNIRDLREEANYTPTRGKFRVYIIDEVHMLSTGAFNALLKTLEEPPAHVIFILATTEVHKLPATILSRCQRFDFKRIQPETMSIRLNEVAKIEGIELEEDAAVLIARIADGALRDGLSILDQCAGREKKVTTKLVSEVAGLAGKESLFEISLSIANKDSASALSIISKLHENSYDMERLCTEMINHFRNLLIVKTVRKSRELIICTDDEFENIIQRAKSFTIENIIYALDLFQDTLQSMKNGASVRIEMEMSLIKLCEPKLEKNISSILSRLSNVEFSVKNHSVETKNLTECVTENTTSQNTNNENNLSPNAEKNPEQVTVNKTENITDGQNFTKNPNAENDKTNENLSNKHENESGIRELNSTEKNQTPQQDKNLEKGSGFQQNSQQTENKADVQEEEFAEFNQWSEVLDVIYENDIGLFSILNSSVAIKKGNIIYIDSPNPTVRDFIKMDNRLKTIIKAIFSVTGENMRVGIKKNAKQKAEERDPLEDLINKAKNNNANITFE